MSNQEFVQQQPGAPIQQQPGASFQQKQQQFGTPIQSRPVSHNQPGIIWCNSNFHSYLANATGFFVKQKLDLIQFIFGYEATNHYTIKDEEGNKAFYVRETSDECSRQLCGKFRDFKLTVSDTSGQDVLIMDRELDRLCCCPLLCSDSTIKVFTPSGLSLGSVVAHFSLFHPVLSIKDAAGNHLLHVKGPCCPVSWCCEPVVFDVENLDGVPIGTITKEWSGFFRETQTDAFNFSISFQQYLDPTIKAIMLAALFLIDYIYFEGKNNKER
uniref:Phospholipid scramblase n=1 Tax=Aceria tosichella TaxID=561515 RepID=A0A6G1SJE9_9ACAR